VPDINRVRRASVEQPADQLVDEDPDASLVLKLPGALGSVRIRLLANLSALSVQYVKDVAKAAAADSARGEGGGCTDGGMGPVCLYRMEGVPPAGVVDKDGNPGPPYALVQVGNIRASDTSPAIGLSRMRWQTRPVRMLKPRSLH
jgi:hypothetical protein